MKVEYMNQFTGNTHVRHFPCGECGRVECGVKNANFHKWSFAEQYLAKVVCEAHAAKRVRSGVNVEPKPVTEGGS